MLDPSTSYHLQLCGRPCTGDGDEGPAQPIGQRIFLQAGTIADLQDGLGLTNRIALPMPPELLDSRWLLEAYELYAQPADGQLLQRLRVADQHLINRPRMPFLPPGAIQPTQDRQPLFHHWQLERNPCPGWLERVHLYQLPGKPFEANAVLYLDQRLQIAAAELFHVPLRHDSGQVNSARRVWVHFTGYECS